jgi:RND family efflux transporter MFP subunit
MILRTSLLLIAASLGLSSCGKSDSEPATATPRRSLAIAVVAARSERSRYETAGELLARDRIEVATKAAGRVLDIPVQEGMRVHRGDVLVRLDVPELQSAWEQSHATEAAAQASATASERQAERFRRLAASQVVTPRDLELAEVSAAGAQAAYAQARAASEMNRQNLAYAVLRAPRDGVIVEKKVDPGDLVLPGVSLLTLEDPRDLEVKTTLPAEVANGIAPGDSAWLASSLSGTTPIRTVVDRVSPGADGHAIVAFLKAGSLRAPSGTFVRVTLFGGAEEQALRLPESALLRRGSLTGVFAVRDGRAALRWLRLTTDARIAAGLAPGDSFVVLPPADLQDGDLVDALR